MEPDVTKTTGGFYAVVPATLLFDENLSDAAVLLYATISQLFDFSGECYASNAYLSSRRNCSERTITRLLAQLEEAGYIKCCVETRHHRSIRVITPAGVSCIDKNVHHRQKCLEEVDNFVHQKNKKLILIPPVIPPCNEDIEKTTETALLADILKLYPRVEKVLPAQRAVLSAAKECVRSGRFSTIQESLAYLRTRVAIYANSQSASNVQFIPDACRWFSDCCYDADPAVWGVKPESADPLARRKKEAY